MKRFVNGVDAELAEDPSIEVAFEGDRLIVRSPRGTSTALTARQGDTVFVSYQGRQFVVESGSRTRRLQHAAHSGEIHASMPGLITSVAVAAGESVSLGAKLLVLEAMKTQQAFLAPFDGTVARVDVAAGDQVVEGQLLAVVAPVMVPATSTPPAP